MHEQIKSLVLDGVSLIPVTEQKPKKPFQKWKERKDYDIIDLGDDMYKYKTNAVAIRCGLRSGQLICLDIDIKNKIGIDATLFESIREVYPILWERLRIERTPSGGYHVYYRVSQSTMPAGIGGEVFTIGTKPNLAGRPPTEDELVQDPKRKSYDFIELKAEGSLSHCYPSPGYTIHKEKDDFSDGRFFSTITYQDHCSIIALCAVLDEHEFKAPSPIPTQTQKDFYSVNPYEDFDLSAERSKVLHDAGWKLRYKRGDREFYSKPSRSDTDLDIDATYSIGNNLYKIWSTTTGIDSKSYTPCNLLAEIEYNGDKKQLYAHLVAKGYGKIKPEREKRIIKNRAKFGGELPANISIAGREAYDREVKRMNDTYPYGIFWSQNDDGVYKINRELIYDVAHSLGFRKHNAKTCFIDGYMIREVSDDYFYDCMKQYIIKGIDTLVDTTDIAKDDTNTDTDTKPTGESYFDDEDNKKDEDLLSCYEAFLQNSGKFTISRLRALELDNILKPTKQTSYKFFLNCYLRIDAETVEMLEYTELDKLIWEHSIQKREFQFKSATEYVQYGATGKGLYFDFLRHAVGITEHVKVCIGYYAHDYRDEEGYFVIATEQCENPSDGGGSGKNIFCNLFELTVSYKSVPASLIKKDNNLLQSWDGQRIFCLGDMPKGFDLVFFKDIITGNAVVNKKYINEYSISIEEMPKILGSSNFSFDDTDPGIKRRVRAIEFTDFFTKAGGVKKHYGKMFPKDWDNDEYAYYDNFIVACIQSYLKADNIIEKNDLSSGGWIKQYEQKYTHMRDFLSIHVDNWILLNGGKVSNDLFRKAYLDYCQENNINLKFALQAKKLNMAIVDYCEHYGYEFLYKNETWESGGIQVRGRKFKKIGVEDVIPEPLPF